MFNWFVEIAEVSLLAVLTVPAVSEMSTLNADASTDASRQLVELHVETTLTGMLVALARYRVIITILTLLLI